MIYIRAYKVFNLYRNRSYIDTNLILEIQIIYCFKIIILNIESELKNQLMNKTEEINEANIVNEIHEGKKF